jgi:hypothetical protein
LEGYKEKHHILPKCLGGDNKKENLVELTAREHFLCHMLLCEIYPNETKLTQALWLMIIGKGRKNHQQYKISSKTYELLKIKNSSIQKTKTPNKGKKHSKETKEKMSKSHIGLLPSEETKFKMSQSAKNKIRSKDHNENLKQSLSNSLSKPILQKDLNNHLIKEWPSGKQASQELNLNYTAINNCCRNNAKNISRQRDKSKFGKYTSQSYIWEYGN